MDNKPVIGLAGGIGSGKSEVARILASLGCVVADSDAAARAALNDSGIRERIVQEFGKGVLRERTQNSEVRAQPANSPADALTSDHRPLTSEIDRSALAHIVFNDPAKRRALESIIHPWVEQRRLEQFAAAPPSAPALVIDAPLLFEAGLDRICDAVIFVDTPRNIRLERVGHFRGRGWTEAELDRRERSQMPLDEKRKRAHYVLANTGSIEALAEQTREILATIVRAHTNR